MEIKQKEREAHMENIQLVLPDPGSRVVGLLMEPERCACVCHFLGETNRLIFDACDGKCCKDPGGIHEEWEARLPLEEKCAKILFLSSSGKTITTKDGVEKWVSEMDIPVHIKNVLQAKVANTTPQCNCCSDVKLWVFGILHQFL